MKNLTLAWVGRVNEGAGQRRAFRRRRARRRRPRRSSSAARAPATSPPAVAAIKGTPLMVDGTLYVTMPDNVWALDARDGRELWHYFWRTKGSTHIANRGVGIWNDYLYFETPDNYLVSLEARRARSGGTRKSPISTSSTSRRPRRSSSAIT